MLAAQGIAVACRLCLPLVLSSCAATLPEHLHFYSADHEGDFDNRLLASRGLDQDSPSPGLGLTWDFGAPRELARGITREDLLALLLELHEETNSDLVAAADAPRGEAWLELHRLPPMEATTAAEPALEERLQAQAPPEIVAEEAPRTSAPAGKGASPGNS